MTRTGLLAASAVSLCLSGCGLSRTAYETPMPVVPVQGSWTQTGLPATVPMSTSADWWTRFEDPRLDALVLAVLENSQDLAAAGLRLRQARLQADLASSRQMPRLSGAGNASATRPFEAGPTQRTYDLKVGPSWEVDLWGRLGAQADAAHWTAAATEQDLAATRLSLIGSTIDLYFRLGYLNERLRLADQDLQNAQRRQALAKARYAAGEESALALQETRESLATQEAARSQLIQQRTEARNALGVLLGSGHGHLLSQEPVEVSQRSVPVPDAGTPASLLARRPDLQASEARLRSLLSQVDATRASFYPTLTLTGTAGGASASLNDLLSNPVGSVAAALTLPFLDVTGQRLTNASARTEYDEAQMRFRQTLVTALSEVEGALSAGRELAVQGQQMEQAIDAARRSEAMNEVRYRAGQASLRELLDSQDRRRAAERMALDNHLARLASSVDLYLALGGDTAL